MKSNDYKNLSQDSLDYYVMTSSISYSIDNDTGDIAKGCGYMNTNSLTYFFPTNAFEMLKFSGAMRQIDKELLQYIWAIYSIIEGAKRTLDANFELKKDESMKEAQLIAEGKTIDAPMKVFYSTYMPYETQRLCNGISEDIKEVISILEKMK